MQISSIRVLSTALVALLVVPSCQAFFFVPGLLGALFQLVGVPIAGMAIADALADNTKRSEFNITEVINARAVRVVKGKGNRYGVPDSDIEDCRLQNLAYPRYDGIDVLTYDSPHRKGDVRLQNVNEGCMNLARDFMGRDKSGPHECGPACLEYRGVDDKAMAEFRKTVQDRWVGRGPRPTWN